MSCKTEKTLLPFSEAASHYNIPKVQLFRAIKSERYNQRRRGQYI